MGLGLGWLERAVDAVGRTWHGMDGGAMGDTTESVLLLVLCGCLWLVLWRRRNLRANQQQVEQRSPSSFALVIVVVVVFVIVIVIVIVIHSAT